MASYIKCGYTKSSLCDTHAHISCEADKADWKYAVASKIHGRWTHPTPLQLGKHKLRSQWDTILLPFVWVKKCKHQTRTSVGTWIQRSYTHSLCFGNSLVFSHQVEHAHRLWASDSMPSARVLHTITKNHTQGSG